MNGTALVAAFLAHVVIADEQLDWDEEIVVHEVLSEEGVSDPERQTIREILSGKGGPGLEEIVLTLSKQDRNVQRIALLRAVQVAFMDGYLDEKEKAVLERARQKWEFDDEEFAAIQNEATQSAATVSPVSQHQGKLPQKLFELVRASIARVVHKIFGRRSLSVVPTLESRLNASQIDIENLINHCSEIAMADVALALQHLEHHKSALQRLVSEVSQSLDAIAGTSGDAANEVRASLRGIQDHLEQSVANDLKSTEEALYRKQRARHTLTISLLGKTKAGKSTLFSVLTGKGFDGIGEGGQGTTYFRRSYRWGALRLVDTPGTEVADEKRRTRDRRVALDVVDESDIVLVVVTNDAQLENELQLLEELSKRRKPIAIIFNHKDNLDMMLQDFCANPTDWLQGSGARTITEHFGRITRATKKHFQSEVPIIPVQLYAAHKAWEEPKYAKELIEGSNIGQLLDYIHDTIATEGVLRRSQNILDGTRLLLGKLKTGLEYAMKNLQRHRKVLESKGTELTSTLHEAFGRHSQNMKASILALFKEAETEAVKVSFELADEKSADVGHVWESHLMKLEKKIKSVFHAHFESYRSEVQESLDEWEEDLSINETTFKRSNGAMEKVTWSFPWRETVKWFSLAVQVVVSVIFPKLRWAAGLIGRLFRSLANLFKSKEQRRREAAARIEATLTENLRDHRKSVTTDLEKQFRTAHESCVRNIESKLDALLSGVQHVFAHQKEVYHSLDNSIEVLDKAFVWRGINFVRYGVNAPVDLDEQEINREVNRVERKSEREITVSVYRSLPKQVADVLSKLLNEHFSFVTTKEETQ